MNNISITVNLLPCQIHVLFLARIMLVLIYKDHLSFCCVMHSAVAAMYALNILGYVFLLLKVGEARSHFM